MSIQATILNIQRFTLHDGPGIRTEFFLKGCPLRCDWCGNPESFQRHIEVGVYSDNCISTEHCADCQQSCPQSSALIFSNANKLQAIDKIQCSNCLQCVNECPAEAIKQWGKLMSVEQSMAIIQKDLGFYQRSGGGVTVSGGEPLMQSEYVLALFQQCQQQGIHTCLESSFYSHWDRIEKIMPYTNLFISDIKMMDNEKHKQYTGVSNHKILNNLRKLIQTDHDLILRIPLIPTINDTWSNIEATADFILHQLQGRIQALQLLSFMRLGEEKYQSLGLPYHMQKLEFDRREFQLKVQKIADYFNQRGIHCLIGTKNNN